MKITKLFIITIFCITFASCKNNKNLKKDLVKVKTKKIFKSDFIKKINLVGEIEACQSVDIYPKVNGIILSYKLEDGSIATENTFVKKNQIFATIENSDLLQNLKRSEANLEMANANLNISNLNLLEIKKDLSRMENLYKNGSLSEKQMESIITNEKKTTALYDQALSRVKDAKASYDLAKNMYDNSFVKSPIDGVITKRYISENNQINLMKPIANISNLKDLKITLNISEKNLPLINKKNTSINIKVDSYPNKLFKAQISNIFPTIDKMTRMGTIELKMTSNELLKPGMYANIEIQILKDKKTLTVPFSSLIYHNGSYMAYIFKEGKAHLKKLSIGDRNDQEVEIISGIEEEDNLIIAGQNRLTDQIEVNPILEKLEVKNETN
ncbi:MAG: Macrolide export protein MacA [Candidatus Anoxychlamydiales bacterium]|nr:Macrolide export protein MacA [Candidatus Anoxychlamydiales bacterium]